MAHPRFKNKFYAGMRTPLSRRGSKYISLSRPFLAISVMEQLKIYGRDLSWTTNSLKNFLLSSKKRMKEL